MEEEVEGGGDGGGGGGGGGGGERRVGGGRGGQAGDGDHLGGGVEEAAGGALGLGVGDLRGELEADGQVARHEEAEEGRGEVHHGDVAEPGGQLQAVDSSALHCGLRYTKKVTGSDFILNIKKCTWANFSS